MTKATRVSRRRFLETAGLLAAAPAARACVASAVAEPGKMPTRKLGSTGVEVSILGLGGGGRGKNPQIRGTPDRPEVQELAERIIHEALDAGVNYFDSCVGYGESERILGLVAATRRKEMFLATKCTKCDASGDQLRKEIDLSLQRLQTDRIDLWQIHNIRNLQDVFVIFQKDRAIDVALEAKRQGIARFIGVTVHGSRAVIEATLDRCRRKGLSMDTLLMSFNPADSAFGGHGKRVLAKYPSIGKIAMKTLGSDGAPILGQMGVSAETALRYVLTQGFATAIVGVHSMEELAENIRVARTFQPLDEDELGQVESRVSDTSQNLWALRA